MRPLANPRRNPGASGGSSAGRKQKDPELVAIGARARALRDAAGLTQEEVAEAADMHWTYVGQVERGERNLSYKSLLRLARGLGVDAAALVGEGEREPD